LPSGLFGREPYPHRVELQLTSFLENPNIAFSMAGFNIVDIRYIGRDFGMHTIFTRFGVTPGGLPSCWMLDRKKWITIPRLDINKLLYIGPHLDISIMEHCMCYYPGLTIACPLFQYTYFRTQNLGDLEKYWKPYVDYFNKILPKLHALIDYHISSEWEKETQKDVPIINDYHNRTESLLNPPIDYPKQIATQKLHSDEVLFRIWHQIEWVKPIHLSYKEWVKQYE
jgi:hypothetical protein